MVRGALAARLPSPAAVRAARMKAAEVIEEAISVAVGHAHASERDIANDCADTLFDLARQYLGTHDEGGDVDGLATLGELEEKARELREVE